MSSFSRSLSAWSLSAVCIRAVQFPHPFLKWMDLGVCSQSGPGERHHCACPRKSIIHRRDRWPTFTRSPKCSSPLLNFFFLQCPSNLCEDDCTAGGGGWWGVEHNWLSSFNTMHYTEGLLTVQHRALTLHTCMLTLRSVPPGWSKAGHLCSLPEDKWGMWGGGGETFSRESSGGISVSSVV